VFRPILWLALGLLLALSGCQGQAESLQLSLKAKSLWENGHYEDAARTFTTLTELYPGSPLVEESLFWASNLFQYYLKEREPAARYYQQLIVRFPEGRYFYPAKGNLAELYEGDKDTLYRALQIYQQLVLAAPLKERHDYFQLKIGSLYLRLGRMDQAREAFRDLLAHYPNSSFLPETYYLVGTSYYLEERYALALAVFRRTAQRFAGTPIANRAEFFVADTLEERGHMKEALLAFQALKATYPDPQIVDKRIKTLEARLRRGVR
jgi:TolA-binding protein